MAGEKKVNRTRPAQSIRHQPRRNEKKKKEENRGTSYPSTATQNRSKKEQLQVYAPPGQPVASPVTQNHSSRVPPSASCQKENSLNSGLATLGCDPNSLLPGESSHASAILGTSEYDPLRSPARWKSGGVVASLMIEKSAMLCRLPFDTLRFVSTWLPAMLAVVPRLASLAWRLRPRENVPTLRCGFIIPKSVSGGTSS